MTTATFNGVTLPLDFQYNVATPLRVSVEPTMTSVDIQSSLSYHTCDESIDFSCRFASSTVRNAFFNAAKAPGNYTFVDYNGATMTVSVIEFNSKDAPGGLYHIEGRMQRIA